MASVKKRYEGTRWSIVYGSNSGVELHALIELQRIVQIYLPYVLEVRLATNEIGQSDDNIILIGACTNNHLIRELSEKKQISIPNESQGYTIKCCNSPWNDKTRLVVIAGSDSRGVLYGVNDFNSRVLTAESMPRKLMYKAKLREPFDNLKDFTVSEYPLIENRGIWTWGYVIYDYRRFLNNMARLNMNIVTIWNDCVPLNCKEIIDHAHSRGIKVILGFHWGWGRDYDLANPAHRQQIKEDVIRTYTQEYRGLGMDGIYFQTLTEHQNLELNGRSVATIACEMVNDISSELFSIDPDIYIQFGIHATSIVENYPDLKPLDPRITIVWEDAGLIPYTYEPLTEKEFLQEQVLPQGIDTQERTISYSKQLATFRNDTEFAMVAKGWTSLDWEYEFENHKNFILGERDSSFIRKRLDEKQPRWDMVNALWWKNYPYAMRFYSEMLQCAHGAMTISALVDDGVFEEVIQPSVALFAETVWNPRRNAEEILQRAMNPYYRMHW
ncbi:MAG: hypothetical protein ACYC54_11615 [Sedimentisphaerales bacterium]